MNSALCNHARRFLHCSNVLRSLARTSKEAEELSTKRARLLYQSKKRGILENDILLGDFAEQSLPSMSSEELTAYDKLINGEHMEWDLYYYLSGRKEAPADVTGCSVYQRVKKFVDEKRAPRK